ncbi:MAG TPA: response regulator [Candidatus Dormibacteraeota bacterium]|nr:response regulator [Candidatus Dormibacteraeota bacterium]
MPDSADLSSALGQAVDGGRQFLARVESLAGSVAAELAKHEQARREWADERQALSEERRQLQAQLDSLNTALASVRDTVRKLEQERLQVTADRDQIRQAREAMERELGGVRDKLQAAEHDTARIQAELATSAAEVAKAREQLAVVSKDRDTLQADQIQWGLDREQLLAEQARLKERASALEADLATERSEFEGLQARHAELTEQSNKLAADWATRRQALAAEIAAQNEEMEQVRRALQASQERDRRVVPAPASPPVTALNADLSHVVNSRLNTLVGFSSVLLDERANPLSPEERREYVKYLHDSALKLGEAVRSVTGSRPANAENRPPVVDPERRPPDILVADNDQASRQRIEPFLKRAGYEVVYVENGPRALEKASHLQPLAILLDASLPPSGASTLVRELRKDPRTREIPMVLLTSPSGPPIAIADCEVLTKPIDRQQLVQLMVRFDLMADSKRARKMPANVLVIDDDSQAVSLVKAILKPFNVRVTAVDNGRSGIEHALRNKPDLVILDLLMPDIDGFEVVTSLRRDKDMSRVPILIHTAKPLSADDRQRLDGKVESIVEKAEFQPERFLELLLKRGERRKRAA